MDQRPLRERCRTRFLCDRGAAVAEFPLVAALIVVIALVLIQAAVIIHTRNTLIDAAVQGAHHGALIGSSVEDGERRAETLIRDRFGSSFAAEAKGARAPDGTITVEVAATLPLIGLIGPSGTLHVEGRAVDESSW